MAKAKVHTLFFEHKNRFHFSDIPVDVVLVMLTRWQSTGHGTFYIMEQRYKENDTEEKVDVVLVGPTMTDAVRQAVKTFDELLEKHPNKGELQ